MCVYVCVCIMYIIWLYERVSVSHLRIDKS